MRDIKELFFVLLRKWWIFVLVMLMCVCGNFLLAKKGEMIYSQYTVEGTLYMTQKKNEETGEFLDNVSRNQPVLDSIEILQSGDFINTLREQSQVEADPGELKNALKFERAMQSRIIKFSISMSERSQLERVSETFIRLAPEYLTDIMEGTSAIMLDDEKTLTIKESSVRKYTVKKGIIQGIALCCFASVLIGLLYFSGDAVRFPEEFEEMGLSLAAELKKEKGDDTVRQNENEMAKLAACLCVRRNAKKILLCSSLAGEGSEDAACALAHSLGRMGKKVLFFSAEGESRKKSAGPGENKVVCGTYGDIENQLTLKNEEYDFIVVSGQALSESSRSILLADLCDETILVVEANRVGKRQIITSADRLKAGRHGTVSVILNRAENIYGVIKKPQKMRR